MHAVVSQRYFVVIPYHWDLAHNLISGYPQDRNHCLWR